MPILLIIIFKHHFMSTKMVLISIQKYLLPYRKISEQSPRPRAFPFSTMDSLAFSRILFNCLALFCTAAPIDATPVSPPLLSWYSFIHLYPPLSYLISLFRCHIFPRLNFVSLSKYSPLDNTRIGWRFGSTDMTVATSWNRQDDWYS